MPRRQRWLRFVGVALVLASCRQLVGIGDAPPGQPGLDAGDGDALEAATSTTCGPDAGPCCACLEADCAAPTAQCEADASCKHSLDCLLGCGPGDEVCSSGCVQRFDAVLATTLACRAGSCAVACDLSCGGVFGVLYPDLVAAGGQACGACPAAQSKACGDLTTCAAGVTCLEYAACLERSCTAFDRACISACEVAAGESTAAETLWNDLPSACGQPCQLGTDWSCVGAWTPISDPQQNGQVTVGFRLRDVLSSQSLAGVTVQSCPYIPTAKFDGACAPDAAVGSSQTDANGFVQLSAVVTDHLVFDYWVISGGGAFPTLLFLDPWLDGPLAGSTVFAPWSFTVATMSDVASLPLDPALGHISVLESDCLHVSAPGVSFEVSPPTAGSITSYLPSGGATTDSSGTAAIFNLAPGTVTLSALVGSQVVARMTLPVQAQTLTSVLLAPLSKSQ